jgi:hypothetical protein
VEARVKAVEAYIAELKSYLNQVATPLEKLFATHEAREMWQKREAALKANPNWLKCHELIRTRCFHLLLTLINRASGEFQQDKGVKGKFMEWLGSLHPGLGLLTTLISAREDQQTKANISAATHNFLHSTRAIEQLSLHFAYHVTVSYRRQIAFLREDQIPVFANMVHSWLFTGLKNVSHDSFIYKHPISTPTQNNNTNPCTSTHGTSNTNNPNNNTHPTIEDIDALAFRFRLLLLEINSPRSGTLTASGPKSSKLLSFLNQFTDIPTFTNAKLMTTDKDTNHSKHKRPGGKGMRPWTERVLQNGGFEAQQDVLNYITVQYNNFRLHSSLGYKNPSQFEREFKIRGLKQAA